jgi:Protein of unknown function (DUF3035)
MQKPLTLVALIAATAASAGVTGCSSLNGDRVAPDEFRVVTNAPLTLPPDYALRPPRPGEARPQTGTSADEARQALFGQDLGQRATTGERQLVANAGAETAPADIRETVDFEGATIVHRSEDAANRVIEYQGSSAPAPEGLTAEQQAARTADEEAARRVTGGATVVIAPTAEGRVKLPGT